MKHVLPIMILSTALVNSCGIFVKKNDKKENQVDTVESMSFTMPNKDEENLLDYKDLETGEYNISDIFTSYENLSDSKFKSLFKHSMNTPGDPKENDPIRRATDFSKVDTAEKTFYPAVEINLPLRIKKNDSEIKFLDKHYYWNQNISDGGWGWSLSGEQSPRGDQFHKTLENAKQDGAFYSFTQGEVSKNIVFKKIDTNSFQIFVEHRQSDLVTMYRLTYTK